MCGRTAQTHQSVVVAARSLGVPEASIPKEPSAPPSENEKSSSMSMSMSNRGEAAHEPTPTQQKQQHLAYEWHDNYNMSPGMDAYVLYNDGTELRCDLKRWGLLTRGGTSQTPLDTSSMAQHFSLRMFNARTDTLMEKPTFARLYKMGNTCVVSLQGFFEWKETPGPQKKQPYFVHSEQSPYLLLAGLWTRVPTGRSKRQQQHDENGDEGGPPEYLDTFTILTTDVSPSLKWLHTRMPVILDEASAQFWLSEPRRDGGKHWTHQRQVQLLNQLEHVAHSYPVNWHPVTPQMSSLKFRSIEAVQPIKEPKSIASFFASASSSSAASSPIQPTFKKAAIVASSSMPSKAAAMGDAADKKRRRDVDDNDDDNQEEGRSSLPRSTKRPARSEASPSPSVAEDAGTLATPPPPSATTPNSNAKPPRGAAASSSKTNPPAASARKTLHSFFSPKKSAAAKPAPSPASNAK